MRLRKVKNQNKKIRKNELTVVTPKELKGRWNEEFGNNNPIWIEIGMGLGGFLSDYSLLYPEINFVGIEKYSKVLVRAIKRFDPDENTNVKLLRFDANELDEVFGENEVSRIFLNFSDPWPKRRHEKRRLTHPDFISMYERIITKDGEVHFKTDNLDLFTYSVDQFRKSNFEVIKEIYDLHKKENVEVKTEYETKFINKGVPIKKLVAKRTIL
jgi:tRNA (guanine-N7-)-methyltransferase